MRVLFKDSQSEEELNFRASGFSRCPVAWLRDMEILAEGKEIELTDELETIFDHGTQLHSIVEYEEAGSRSIVGIENEFFAKYRGNHARQSFSISGHVDFFRQDSSGFFIEDLKTTSSGGFFYKLREYAGDKFPVGYVIQTSVYGFLVYVKHKIVCDRGVIRFVSKDVLKDPSSNKSHRMQLALPFQLWKWDQTQDFILQHPVVRVLAFGEDEFIIDSAMESFIPDNKWMCVNCTYRPTCGWRQ